MKLQGMRLDAIRAQHGDAFVDSVYKNSPTLTYSFIPGAPGVLLTNPNPSRGMANGVACEMHSLTFPEEYRERVGELMSACSDPVFNVPEDCRPTHVNVRLIGPPLPANPTEAESAAHSAWVQSYADVTLVKGDVVIPVAVEKSRKTESAYAGGGARLDVVVTRPSVDLAYSRTVHKSQSLTLKQVIVDGQSIDSYHGLYVAASRVRRGDGLRFLIGSTRQERIDTLRSLERLTPPAE
jgi:hypothetical protein